MKRLTVILLVVLALGLFAGQAEAKAFGPVWALWNHSVVPAQCAVKTGFWWIGGWAVAIWIYDHHIRPDGPTSREQVIEYARLRGRREP